VAIVEDVAIKVEVRSKLLAGLEGVGLYRPAELIWSPDSTVFAVTQTDGGAVGTWFVTLFLVEKGRVRHMIVAKEVVTHAHKRFTCVEPQPPNVAAVTWVNGSRHLLLVAEVPPHSNCHEMGRTFGYLVSVPTGRIVREISARELEERWGKSLGERPLKMLRSYAGQ
jgi:hypothetical protein